MILINVSGCITEQVDCSTDLEALVYLENLKNRHSDIVRPILLSVAARPPSYLYKADIPDNVPTADRQYSSLQWQRTLRTLTSKHPLKVEISHYEDMGDLV